MILFISVFSRKEQRTGVRVCKFEDVNARNHVSRPGLQPEFETTLLCRHYCRSTGRGDAAGGFVSGIILKDCVERGNGTILL